MKIPTPSSFAIKCLDRTCIKSLFEHSFSIHLWIKALLGELLNGSLEIFESEVDDQLQLS
jgi:hypothetical protein